MERETHSLGCLAIKSADDIHSPGGRPPPPVPARLSFLRAPSPSPLPPSTPRVQSTAEPGEGAWAGRGAVHVRPHMPRHRRRAARERSRGGDLELRRAAFCACALSPVPAPQLPHKKPTRGAGGWLGWTGGRPLTAEGWAGALRPGRGRPPDSCAAPCFSES